ncbi:MAG: glutamate--tRNA ligase [Armatimonadetes bacterium]|nr:glutamate--tRNA ligase [Armatimonadota bacterium]
MVRVRYAPSPTGRPHIGNLRSALMAWCFARHHGGRFLLRIEDTDTARYVEGSVEAIYDSLEWLGMNWDEGPVVGGPCGPYFQSERLDIYPDFAERMIVSGDAYRCFCPKERLDEVRAGQQARKEPPMYDRHCRNLPASQIERLAESGIPSVVRLAVPLEGATTYRDAIHGEVTFENGTLDDIVLMKSDGYPTYNFANVVDDHLMKITHVIRGEEFIPSTPKHILVYRALGLEPPIFAHVPMVKAPDGSKLSKRYGATTLQEFRNEGYLPETMFNFMALLGWSPGTDEELLSREEIVRRFSLEGISKSAAIFNKDKLNWMNGEYIRALSVSGLTDRCLPFLKAVGLVSEEAQASRNYIESVIALTQERLRTLNQIAEFADFFFTETVAFDEKAVQKWFRHDYVPEALRRVRERFTALEPFSTEAVEAAARLVAEEMGLENASKIIHPLRVALSGRTVGPGLFEMTAVLGRERCVKRLDSAVGMLS